MDSDEGEEQRMDDVPASQPTMSALTALASDPSSQATSDTRVPQPRPLSTIDNILVENNQPEPEEELEDQFNYEKGDEGEEEVTSAQQETVEEGDKENVSSNEKFVRQVVSQLPVSKIKRLMKMDPDTKLIQNDSVLLVAFATELFIKALSTAAARVAVKNKRKTVKKEDIEVCVKSLDYFEFLEGML